MTSKLKCLTCGHEQEAPKHCNRPMQLQKVDGKDKLVCWMGADCGTSEIPQHCGASMRAAA